MRLVAAILLIGEAVPRLRTELPVQMLLAYVLAILAGALLLVGLWTPVSGLVLALFELWSALAEPGDPWAKIPLGTLGIALALLGPGAWSIDARLFGWKRINIRGSKAFETQKSRQNSP